VPIGLTYAALVAGADQVLATLAPVSDAAAARFVDRFYRELWLNHRSADRALQATQVAMLGEREWARPAYWASYVLSGAASSADAAAVSRNRTLH
jgi:CHAT domain-containing protein